MAQRNAKDVTNQDLKIGDLKKLICTIYVPIPILAILVAGVHAQCTLTVGRMILSCNKYIWVMFIRALKNDASTSGLQSSSEPQRYIDSLQSAVQVCVFM